METRWLKSAAGLPSASYRYHSRMDQLLHTREAEDVHRHGEQRIAFLPVKGGWSRDTIGACRRKRCTF